jgi:heme oxygenase (biliverdin-producing, ferredoxin)
MLKPTYKPDVLSRTASLSSDIAFLLGTSEWQTHGIYQELSRSPPSQLSTFVNRLYSLSSSSNTSYLFLAHAYVRYLGDLSGGQTIRRQLVKAYKLPQNGDGVRFYTFSSGEEELSPTEIKELKEWYRNGMNSGVGDDKVRKGPHL